VDIEELEQYGRRNSLRFHNVTITKEELNKTDDKIVDICKQHLKIDITPVSVRFQLFLLFKNLILYLPVTEATNKLARTFMVDFTDYMRPVDIIWGYVYL
jgi:hypothetical protein